MFDSFIWFNWAPLERSAEQNELSASEMVRILEDNKAPVFQLWEMQMI